MPTRPQWLPIATLLSVLASCGSAARSARSESEGDALSGATFFMPRQPRAMRRTRWVAAGTASSLVGLHETSVYLRSPGACAAMRGSPMESGFVHPAGTLLRLPGWIADHTLHVVDVHGVPQMLGSLTESPDLVVFDRVTRDEARRIDPGLVDAVGAIAPTSMSVERPCMEPLVREAAQMQEEMAREMERIQRQAEEQDALDAGAGPNDALAR